MEKQILQIESIGADEIFNRLERIENAILKNSTSSTVSPDTKTEFLTRKEVAIMLHISLVTINDWVQKGILKAYKMGNRVYFKASEVESSMIQKGSIYANR